MARSRAGDDRLMEKFVWGRAAKLLHEGKYQLDWYVEYIVLSAIELRNDLDFQTAPMSISDLECSEIWKQTPIRAEKSWNKLHSKQMFPCMKALCALFKQNSRRKPKLETRLQHFLMHNFLNTHFSGSKPAQPLFFPLLLAIKVVERIRIGLTANGQWP